MNIEILKALVPLFLGIFEQFYKDNGRVPTLDEMQAKLDEDLTKFIMIGDKWLSEHPQTSSDKDSTQSMENDS